MNHSIQGADRLWKKLLVFGTGCCIIFALFANAVLQLMSQDEEQYVAGGYFAQHEILYQDFLYLQPPIYPLLLSVVFKILPASFYFLAARLTIAVFAAGSVWFIYSLARRFTHESVAALVVAVLYATSSLMLVAFGSTRNDLLPVFFGLFGVWMLLESFGSPNWQRWLRFASGMAFALAVGVKVTVAFIPVVSVPYLYYRIYRLQGALGALSGTIWLVAGGIVGAIPLIYYLALSPDNFIYAIATFHMTGPAYYYSDAEAHRLLQFDTKIAELAKVWTTNLVLGMAVVYGLLCAVLRQPVRDASTERSEIFTSEGFYMLALCVVALPFVLLPTPWWQPYVTPMVPFIFLGCAALYGRAYLRHRPIVHSIVVGWVLLAVLLQIGRLAGELKNIGNTDHWTPIEVYQFSSAIKKTLADEGISGPVATLYPLMIFDAGGAVTSRFATGIYFFRSGDYEPVDRVIELNALSPKAMQQLFKTQPPAAVFGGGTRVDDTLRDWAKMHCYKDKSNALASWYGGAPYHAPSWQPWLYTRPLVGNCAKKAAMRAGHRMP